MPIIRLRPRRDWMSLTCAGTTVTRSASCGNPGCADVGGRDAGRDQADGIAQAQRCQRRGIYCSNQITQLPSNVSGWNYDYVVNLVREFGKYPLRLGEFDIPEMAG